MIDINELRRLAQAATPGPWMIDYVGVGFEVAAGESVIAQSQQVQGDIHHKARKANAAFIAAANPATTSELLDRLEAAEKSDAESIAMYRKARDERDALRAKVEQMERQVPICRAEDITHSESLLPSLGLKPKDPLYAHPGAQPAPSVPETWLERGLKELDAIRQNADRDDWQPNDESLVRRLYQAMVADGLQQAPSVPSIPEAVMEVIAGLVYEVERNICPHEETHRGGQWEICDMCGAKWADDRGGKPEFKWPEVVEKARAMLKAAPEAKS